MAETTRKARAATEEQPPAAAPAPAPEKPAGLSVNAILAAVNDQADDPETVDALQRALYGFGAQDPSMRLPASWYRVQRRLGIDPDKLDGIATAEQVQQFATRTGLAVGAD